MEKTCYTALSEKKIPYYCAGENIAAGQRGPAAVMTAWMNSPGHKANILYKSFNHMGVGYQEGGSYVTNWVQLFVGGCTPTEIKVCGPVSSAKPGMTIEQMGLYLEIKCSMNHGVSYCPISSKMCSGYNKSSKSYQTVTVSYQGKKTTFSVGTVPTPAQVKGLKLATGGKNSAKIAWNSVKCDGFEIYLKAGNSGSSKLFKTLTDGKKKNTYLSGLKANTKYGVKMRAFNLVGDKKKYGKWSSAISFTTKK